MALAQRRLKLNQLRASRTHITQQNQVTLEELLPSLEARLFLLTRWHRFFKGLLTYLLHWYQWVYHSRGKHCCWNIMQDIDDDQVKKVGLCYMETGEGL